MPMNRYIQNATFHILKTRMLDSTAFVIGFDVVIRFLIVRACVCSDFQKYDSFHNFFFRWEERENGINRVTLNIPQYN